MQGESDATSDHLSYASNYREYEDYFIEDLNEDLSHYKEDEDEKEVSMNDAVASVEESKQRGPRYKNNSRPRRNAEEKTEA